MDPYPILLHKLLFQIIKTTNKQFEELIKLLRLYQFETINIKKLITKVIKIAQKSDVSKNNTIVFLQKAILVWHTTIDNGYDIFFFILLTPWSHFSLELFSFLIKITVGYFTSTPRLRSY